MATMKDVYQSGDWNKEKHVPSIDAPDTVKKGETISMSIGIGKEIAHPNTTEHHISWVAAYFLPDGEKFPYCIGRAEFTAHGASVQGPDTSSIYTAPQAVMNFKTEKSGTIMASSYCTIHGLWENAKKVTVQ